MYFIKAYASNFFKTWEPYNGAIAVAGRLKIVIKDPVEGTETVNPPYLDYDPLDTVFVHIPQTTHVWDVDQAPPNQFPVTQYQNMFNADNCIGEVEIIVPASEQIIVYPKHLKASKLYTAIVNNLFDINHNSLLENIAQESAEVHKFVFQTSRYANFNEQINSFYLEQTVEGALAQKESIFRFEKAFTQEEIQASFDVIKNQPIIGFSDGILKTLNNDYQHPYDRIFEGILGLNPLDKPISTEVNIIRDLTTNVVIALIVRNPEPFNNPKFPVNVLADTIEVLNGSTVNPNYSILFSKDNSQAIIMNENKNIDETSLNLKFKYKNYKNIFPGNDPVLNYPVVSEVVLDVDLLNN